MDKKTKRATAHGVNMRRNIFSKAFSGELSLWVTFWIFGFAAIRAGNFFIECIYSDKNTHFWTSFIDQNGIRTYMALAAAIALVAILYKAAIIRGIWISAGKYSGSQVWVYVAKFFMVLWGIGLASETFKTIAIFREQNTVASISSLSRIDSYAAIVGGLVR